MSPLLIQYRNLFDRQDKLDQTRKLKTQIMKLPNCEILSEIISIYYKEYAQDSHALNLYNVELL